MMCIKIESRKRFQWRRVRRMNQSLKLADHGHVVASIAAAGDVIVAAVDGSAAQCPMRPRNPDPADWLIGGGEMGRLVRAVD